MRKQRPTVQSLDDRLTVVEDEMAAFRLSQADQNIKLDKLIGMLAKHDAAKSVRLSRKARLVAYAIGTGIGSAITGLVTGCLW